MIRGYLSMRMSRVFSQILREDRPQAVAHIVGDRQHLRLRGRIAFYRTPLGGILIEADMAGLPLDSATGFFAVHIHENGDCTPPFDRTGSHYNPRNTPHPRHAGDLPPLLSNKGSAWMAVYDERLRIEELIGRSVVIHAGRDDFTTQPAGDSGEKIGCGTIIRIRR